MAGRDTKERVRSAPTLCYHIITRCSGSAKRQGLQEDATHDREHRRTRSDANFDRQTTRVNPGRRTKDRTAMRKSWRRADMEGLSPGRSMAPPLHAHPPIGNRNLPNCNPSGQRARHWLTTRLVPR